MKTCPSCGAAVAGRFCPRCGVPIAPDPGSESRLAHQGSGSGGLAENAACTLCYAMGVVTGVLFLVLEPYNRNRKIRFHAFQALFGHVAMILIWIAAGALLPWRVMFYLGPLVVAGALALWLYLMWKAFRNETVRLPVIGALAEKQA